MYQSINKRVHNCVSNNKCNYSVPKFAQSQWCNKDGQCKRRKDKRGYITQILPDNRLYENKVGCKDRTKYSIIKSGLQPNHNENKYNYSYNDYLNKRLMTYDKKIATIKPNVGTSNTWGYRGTCQTEIAANCPHNGVTYSKKSNAKFYKNGAVSSGSRIDRLKLDTIKGAVRCKNNNAKCNGIYSNASGRRMGYKNLFNQNHKENGCPQDNARNRVLGNFNKLYRC